MIQLPLLIPSFAQHFNSFIYSHVYSTFQRICLIYSFTHQPIYLSTLSSQQFNPHTYAFIYSTIQPLPTCMLSFNAFHAFPSPTHIPIYSFDSTLQLFHLFPRLFNVSTYLPHLPIHSLNPLRHSCLSQMKNNGKNEKDQNGHNH